MNDRQRTSEKLRMGFYESMGNAGNSATMLDQSFAFCRNPLLVLDRAFRMIDYRQEGRVEVRHWQQVIDRGRSEESLMNRDVIESFLDVFVCLTSTKDIQTIELDGRKRYFAPILVGGAFFGVVALLQFDHAVDEYDLAVIKTVADVLAYQMSGDAVGLVGKEDPEGIFLEDLIQGRIASEAELDFRMGAIGLRAKRQYRAIVLRSSRDDKQLEKHLSWHLKSWFSDAWCYQGAGELLFVTRGDDVGSGLRDHLRLYGMCMGVSESFSSPLELSSFYRQARRAIDFGLRMEPEKTSYDYSSYAVHDLASALVERKDWIYLCHPAVRELKAYDERHDDDYMVTLQTYLEQGGSTRKAGELLHMHRNTINYRVQRIRQLFSLDLDDAPTRAHLLLSFLMYQESQGSKP